MRHTDIHSYFYHKTYCCYLRAALPFAGAARFRRIGLLLALGLRLGLALRLRGTGLRSA